MSSNHRAWQPMLTKQTTSAKIKATTLANELGLEVTLAIRQKEILANCYCLIVFNGQGSTRVENFDSQKIINISSQK